jgi:hypothetical protein
MVAVLCCYCHSVSVSFWKRESRQSKTGRWEIGHRPPVVQLQTRVGQWWSFSLWASSQRCPFWASTIALHAFGARAGSLFFMHWCMSKKWKVLCYHMQEVMWWECGEFWSMVKETSTWKKSKDAIAVDTQTAGNSHTKQTARQLCFFSFFATPSTFLHPTLLILAPFMIHRSFFSLTPIHSLHSLFFKRHFCALFIFPFTLDRVSDTNINQQTNKPKTKQKKSYLCKSRAGRHSTTDNKPSKLVLTF